MRSVVVVSVLAAALAAACSLDWYVPPDVEASEAGVDAGADVPSNDVAVVETSAPEASGPDANDPTKPCGSDQSNQSACTTDSLCIFDDFSCGKTASGICASLASFKDCQTVPQANGVGRYCGCNGQSYESACAALVSGVDLALSTMCGAGTDEVQLGYAACTEYLVEDLTRVRHERYRCVSAQNANCTGDAGDVCKCLTTLYCSNPDGTGGKCEGRIVRCG